MCASNYYSIYDGMPPFCTLAACSFFSFRLIFSRQNMFKQITVFNKKHNKTNDPKMENGTVGCQSASSICCSQRVSFCVRKSSNESNREKCMRWLEMIKTLVLWTQNVNPTFFLQTEYILLFTKKTLSVDQEFYTRNILKFNIAS